MFYTYRVDEKIRLKEPMTHYAEELALGISQDYEYLNEFCPSPAAANSTEEAKKLIESYCEWNRTLQGLYSLILVENNIAGVFQLNRLDLINSTTEFGYWIFSKYQGKGLINKCCKAMLEYVFDELKFNRVEIKCAVENVKSQKIPEKFGFTREGILRQNQMLGEKWIDSILYSLLREEWEKMNS
jgi:ribosomal-protein-serine acetyltransferase